MVHVLHSMVGRLCHWCEGCACHDWLRAGDGVRQSKWPPAIQRLEEGRRIMQYTPGTGDGVAFACPMRGKRGPELARGDFHAVIQGIAQHGQAEILEKAGGLPIDELSALLSDYVLGLQRLEQVARTKLECWSRLPWLLCSLADWQEDRSRANAKKIIAIFDASPQDQALHHRITW